MNLKDLIQSVEGVVLHPVSVSSPALLQLVQRMTTDSRKVSSGTLFVALAGEHTDGHQYLAQAVAAGALALVVHESQRALAEPYLQQLPVLICQHSSRALAELAGAFYQHPARTMQMFGVTGTNGKTTVTHLLQQMLQDAGRHVGLIGTLGQKSGAAKSYDTTGHTTPMAVELQEILAGMRQTGVDTVVMEVSSHALSQDRVWGCPFQVVVMTNLTQDHLDFHKTMEHYFQAKSLLFQQLDATRTPAPSAVINLDDAYGSRFVEACPAGISVWTYGIDSPAAKVRAKSVHFGITGASFEVSTPVGNASVTLQIAGKFSIYNALAALAAGLAAGLPLASCVQALASVQGVRGRFEVVSDRPFVVVDYAHTPDGLENVLETAKAVLPNGGRLIAVFGCGGDRDSTKRPKMGRIAERLADILLVTSDNPRSEDPQQIITDILSGIQRFDSERMLVNVDREQAIHQAIDIAQPNDIIVVAGKGHEDYQILGDRVIHFDDREVAQRYVESAGVIPSEV